jgi:phage terminase large subunit-like protein
MPLRDAFARISDAIQTDWQSIARNEQKLPSGDDWSIWLYLAGRGAGKTRAGCEAVREWIETGRCGRVALIAPTAADARDVLIEGASGLLAISPNSFRPAFEPSKRRLSYPNGAIATVYSAEEADRLRGPQHDGLLADELAAWPAKDAQYVWDMAMMGLRIGARPRAIITTTPRPIPILRDLLKRDGEDVVVTRGRTRDNAKNLASSFLTQVVRRYEGTRLGRQELDAEMLTDTPGALWTMDIIDAARVQSTWVSMQRIVVAIDPAVSTSDDSDLTGLVVCGLGDDGHGYLMADASGRYSPVQWAAKAVSLYRQWKADRIVAEVNNGGQMVEACIRSVDPNASYRAVHAARGKVTRAEPISALAEQGKIHHVGSFPELEDELCSYAPGSSAKSPDRMDAMVWGFSDLMITPQRAQFCFG